MNTKKSKKLYKKGLENLVGAVNSPVRAFASVGGNPLFIKKAKGSKIVDVDGNEYVDLVQSYGPMILGHRHKKVQKAVTKALRNGYSFGEVLFVWLVLIQIVIKLSSFRVVITDIKTHFWWQQVRDWQH